MSDLPNEPSDRGSATSSVHAGELRQQEANAITTPIYQTSTFWFRNSKEVTDYQEGKSDREEYGRYGNPTWRAVERKISALEGGEETVLFASGMCAATTTFMALLPPGSHLIVTSDCYRRTRQFIEQFLSRMGVETTVIEPSNLEAFREAIRPDTKLFFTESPTNPYLRVIDVPAFVEVARAANVQIIIDSTFATPVNHRALDDGADLVLHSATKYLGGHNDLLAGTLTGPRELIDPVRKALGVLGGIMDSHAAWLLLAGHQHVAHVLDPARQRVETCDLDIPGALPALPATDRPVRADADDEAGGQPSGDQEDQQTQRDRADDSDAQVARRHDGITAAGAPVGRISAIDTPRTNSAVDRIRSARFTIPPSARSAGRRSRRSEAAADGVRRAAPVG